MLTSRWISIGERIGVPVAVAVCPECGGVLICHLPKARFAMGVPAGMIVDCEVALRGVPESAHTYGSPESTLRRAWTKAALAVSTWARENLRVRDHDCVVAEVTDVRIE